MLQQKGEQRNFSHDLKLAVLLSAAAGSVNSASFFAFDVLTTNVTGHVATMANEMVAGNWVSAQMKFLWMLLFFLGALLSGFSLELIGQKHPRYAHAVPMVLEIIILSAVAYYGAHYDYSRGMTQLLAGGLLFAMGMQNAMVTLISGSVVRTTHLTGLFTDIGLGISKYLVHWKARDQKLRRKITLQFFVILSFFGGGIAGAFLFAFYLFEAYAFAVGILIFALFYDIVYARIKMSLRIAKRKEERRQFHLKRKLDKSTGLGQ
jgi:uncharacterized membrane protein YoaK (UPF0700 family)